jgi:hypothetical protein
MEEQVQSSYHANKTTWREAVKHNGRGTLDQGLQQEASKDDKCPRTVMVGTWEERTPPTKEGLHPKLEREDRRQSGNMSENLANNNDMRERLVENWSDQG